LEQRFKKGKEEYLYSAFLFTADMPLLTTVSTFGLGRRCWNSPQWCCLHRLKFHWRFKCKMAKI